MAVELNLDNIKWPKDFPELKALDDLLRCRICYGYIKTCMITSCSHNYCSLCIRKSIHYKTQCPTCFEEIYEPHLRNNRAFDQFVELFSGIRDKLLRHLRIADTQLSQQSDDPSIPRCIKFEQYSPIPNGDIFKKNKGESSRLKHGSGALDLPKAVIDRPSVSRRLDNEIVSPPLHNEALPTIPKMFLSPKKQVDTVKPKQNIGIPTVPCPVCEVDIPERNINLHLDSCLVRSEKPVTKSPEKKKKRSPLSKMVYSMMSEKDLRKRLKDHGLNSHGDKKTLINRIQRFTVLYNSECDSDNPRPIADIIRQIDKEDNGEKKNIGTLLAQPRLPAVNRKTDPKIIEEENKKYIEENKSSFNALINAVRLREGRHAPPLKRRFEKIVSSSSDDDEPDIIEIPLENKSTEIELLELETSVNIHDGDRTLFDSSDNELSEEYPMSPVLNRTTTPLRNNCLTSNGNLSTKKDCSSVTCLPQVNKGKENKNLTSKIKLFSKSPTDKTVTGICGTQVINYDSDTSAPSPSCIEPEDDDNRSSLSVDSDTEENDELNQDLDKATANFEEIKRKGSKINHSVLEKEYELSEEFSMSPVLKSTITPSKNNNLMAKENISSKKDLSSLQIIKGKENKNLMPKIKLLSKSTNKTVSGNCETQVLCYDSDTSVPSPSCIVPEAEDDDNLSSLSADDDLEDDVLNFTNQDLDQATENYRLKDSQIDDPDFKIQDEDLDLEESEEFFVPTRRSKRKLTTPPPAIKCNTPISQSKRKAKTPISSGTKSPVSRSLRKRAKH